MVMSFAIRSASRMINSNDLRKISARSRGFLPAQPGNASLAASTAALASSTVALATEATLFSVAGSMTSKRAPSEDFRHLPPIHRSVGTLARRLSYIAMVTPVLGRGSSAHFRESGNPEWLSGSPFSRGRADNSTFHRAFYPLDDPFDAR